MEANSLRTDIAYGIAVNRTRKLQKQWDHWFPLRQHDHLCGKTVLHQMAEHECARLAPLLLKARRDAER
jgi:hypothetical protein